MYRPPSFTSVAVVTRPANATPYTAGDVVGAALAAITFPNVGAGTPGGQVMITDASLEIDVAAIPTGMTSFNLYLYSVTPPSALADNAAFALGAVDRPSFLGKLALGTPVVEAGTLFVGTGGLNKRIRLAARSSNLFGYLVTVGGFTPAGNSEVYTVTLAGTGL